MRYISTGIFETVQQKLNSHTRIDKFSYKNLCDSCKQKSCCTDFAEPPLFPSDFMKLENIGKSGDDFVQKIIIENKPIKIIKRKNNSNVCVFWKEGQGCSIYENRPYDCRMFPFDIDWVDGQYRWIVYSCNPQSDWSWTETHLQKLESDPQFAEIIKNIEFFRLTSKNYVDISKEPQYAILRKVNLGMTPNP
jgi:Fe-S-cluster containining protein